MQIRCEQEDAETFNELQTTELESMKFMIQQRAEPSTMFEMLKESCIDKIGIKWKIHDH